MIEFKLLPRSVTLEASIPLKSEAPEAVVAEYESRYSGKLVLWKDIQLGMCGCVHNNRSVVANIDAAAFVTVYEMKPAKSSGWVGMGLRTKNGEELVTLFDSRYSQLSINWLQRTQPKVAEFLQLDTSFVDLGCDT